MYLIIHKDNTMNVDGEDYINAKYEIVDGILNFSGDRLKYIIKAYDITNPEILNKFEDVYIKTKTVKRFLKSPVQVKYLPAITLAIFKEKPHENISTNQWTIIEK